MADRYEYDGLMGAAWLLSLLIAIPWGIYNSTVEYGLSDQTASFISYLGFAMPTFWFGIILQEYFRIKAGSSPLVRYVYDGEGR